MSSQHNSAFQQQTQPEFTSPLPTKSFSILANSPETGIKRPAPVRLFVDPTLVAPATTAYRSTSPLSKMDQAPSAFKSPSRRSTPLRGAYVQNPLREKSDLEPPASLGKFSPANALH